MFAFSSETGAFAIFCFSSWGLPFLKFWNHSERHVDEIDWKTAVAEEKIDGNLMKLFYYKGIWRLASNRTLDVHCKTGKYACTGRSNYDLFAEAARNSKLLYDRLDTRFCYMFERVHPDVRVVLDHPRAMLFHIGTRNMETLQELEMDIGVQRPRQWTVRNRAECQAILDSFHSFAEGLVVRDANYCRQKWKRREYLMLHSARMLVGGDEPCNLASNLLRLKVLWHFDTFWLVRPVTYVKNPGLNTSPCLGARSGYTGVPNRVQLGCNYNHAGPCFKDREIARIRMLVFNGFHI